MTEPDSIWVRTLPPEERPDPGPAVDRWSGSARGWPRWLLITKTTLGLLMILTAAVLGLGYHLDGATQLMTLGIMTSHLDRWTLPLWDLLNSGVRILGRSRAHR